MKKAMVILVTCGMIFSLTACGNSQEQTALDTQSEIVETVENMEEPLPVEETEPSEGQTNVLVAYFAYSENMGDTSDMGIDAITSASVGQTSNTEGNLQVIAQVIQENSGADIFHIVVSEPYDPEYDVMHDRAIDEISNDERPALETRIENLDQYDVIYLGVPVWSGELPAPVMTFLDENDLSGKTIVPFGIHLGSQFGRMLSQIEEKYPSATLLDGLTVNARTDNEEVRAQASEWMESLER